jgi:hypothetical protein
VVIDDRRIDEKVSKSLADGDQWPDPYLSLNPSFASGGSVDELAGASGPLHPECASIFRTGKGKRDETVRPLGGGFFSDTAFGAGVGFAIGMWVGMSISLATTVEDVRLDEPG